MNTFSGRLNKCYFSDIIQTDCLCFYLIIFLPFLDAITCSRKNLGHYRRTVSYLIKKGNFQILKTIFHSSFIICWLPFFTLYLISPFCNDCINPYLFSVVFWIGYCNSAINPMIYALFSKDFRFAFKRIICKCFCSGQGMRQPSSRRGSDMSALRRDGTRTPSISPSAQAQSLGDDSDPITDDMHR